MLSVNKGVVFLLLLKNIENELFSIKGSETSKFKKCFFFELFYVPDDSPFLPDSKTLSFLRIGSVIFEILSFETSLGGGWGFPYSSSICIIPICNLFFKLTTTINSYIYSADRGHPKYVI